jgi:hypothetical protein
MMSRPRCSKCGNLRGLGRSLAIAALLIVPALAAGGGELELDRYKVVPNPTKYPQSSPQKALQSAVTAVTAGDFDYLMAYLADPQFVDSRVAELKRDFTGADAAVNILAFDRLSKQVARYFRDDPALAGELRRLAKEAKAENWTITPEGAVVVLPGPPEVRAYFTNIKGRWHLEDRREPRKK